MTVSESAEPTKPQDGTKDDGKKPVEVKDEDLVRFSIELRRFFSFLILSRPYLLVRGR